MNRWKAGPMWRGALVLAAVVSAGCSSLGGRTPVSRSASAPYETAKLAYRTGSDRLNLLTAAEPPGGQLVSYQQTGLSPVPEFTESTLQIAYPHPGGRAGYALVTVVFDAQPDGASSGFGPASIWKKITGSSSDEGQPADQRFLFRETWTMDIPRWQLDRILAKLREQNYFRKAKVTSANALLATEIDGARFGKDVKELPELDSIIVRIRSQGRLVGRS